MYHSTSQSVRTVFDPVLHSIEGLHGSSSFSSQSSIALWSSSFLFHAGAIRGGRVREGDLCAIKIVKALGSCTGEEDTEEGSSSFFI